MKNTFALVALLGLVAAPAFAADAPKVVEKVVTKETVTTEATATATTTYAELKDGTKVVIKGDMVSVVGKDGKEAPAVDGTWELKDGAKVTTKGGVVVK